MEQLKKCIQAQIEIGNASLASILARFEVKKLPKGQFFLKSGAICRQMTFIDSGYLRMYDLVDGKEITFWMGSKGKFITSLTSFVFQTSNFWNR